MQIIKAEVIFMKTDAIWQAFAETGDPVYYLLYKSLDGKNGSSKRKNDAGHRTAEKDKNSGSGFES